MLQFEIAGNEFRAAKLSALTQLHVSRRIAPILPTILPAMLKAATLKSEDESPDLLGLADAFAPVAEALAHMPDEACEYVYNACLSVVSMQQGSNWVNIWNAANKVAMFDCVDLAVMTQIVAKVLWENLGNFMRGFAAKASPAITQQA